MMAFSGAPRREARNRLLAGTVVFALSAATVRRHGVGEGEARVFTALNRLPDGFAAPVWIVMQGGNLVAAPVAAAVAGATGRRSTARVMLASGAATWGLSKVVKRAVRRPRPDRLLPSVRPRGRQQAGSGFVSGHAGVAASLCAAALPELGAPSRCVAAAAALTIAAARVYVGAHLPLDVMGGAGLGIAVEAAVELLCEA